MPLENVNTLRQHRPKYASTLVLLVQSLQSLQSPQTRRIQISALNLRDPDEGYEVADSDICFDTDKRGGIRASRLQKVRACDRQGWVEHRSNFAVEKV